MSFKKRNVDQQPKLPGGSRLSAYNGQLLISTGVPSLDDILGGGQPVGTIMLIKEDRATTYAQLLLKYFIAQGVASGHHVAVTSRDEDPEEMLKTLMWLANSGDSTDDDDEKTKNARTDAESDRMKIAWRYSHLKRFETGVKAKPASPVVAPVVNKVEQSADSSSTAAAAAAAVEEPKPFCSQFDLTKRVPAEVLQEANTKILGWSDNSQDDYGQLLSEIRKVVLDGNFSSAIPVAPGTTRHALRVAIHSLASPSWESKSPHVCK